MFIYNIFTFLISPFFALWIARNERGKVRLKERFGFWSPLQDGEYVWMHAASVGEVKALERFIKIYKENFQGQN